MLKKVLIIIAMVSNISAGQLNIAVAANVSYAMPQLKKEFNKLYPNIKIRETLSSSGKLTAQIKNGAPYDIFMAANMKYPNALYKDGLAITKPIIYAQGGLAYLSSKKRDFTLGASLLKKSNISKIAIANPKTAPYGKAAIETFENNSILKDIKSKLVYAESINQVVTYSMTAVDIGIIAKSTLYSKKMKHYKKGIHWQDIDSTFYTPINQGIVILKKAQSNSDAKMFYDFILSQKAKDIMKSFGYLIP